MMIKFILLVLGCSKEFHVDVNKEGAPISNFKLQDLEGKKIDSDSILNNGKKTLFIVAAEWCPHCREENSKNTRICKKCKKFLRYEKEFLIICPKCKNEKLRGEPCKHCEAEESIEYYI